MRMARAREIFDSSLIRAQRIVTWHLFVAMGVTIAYLSILKANGAGEIGYFLGAAAAQYPADVAGVEYVLLLHFAMAASFCICRWMDSDMKVHRAFTAAFAALGLMGLLMRALRPDTAWTFDSAMGAYVWGSYLLYALIGPPPGGRNFQHSY